MYSRPDNIPTVDFGKTLERLLLTSMAFNNILSI